MGSKEIVLLNKPIRDKRTWYFYYKYSDDGIHFSRSGRFSTGVDVDESDIEKSRRRALKMARHLRWDKEKERRDTQTRERFDNYTRDWFVWDLCPYLTAERARGRKPSRSNADNNRGILLRKILPYFGKFRIKEITAEQIESWLFWLKDQGLTGRSVNAYYSVLQKIFSEATRLGAIRNNPCLNVRRMAETKKKREILTSEEYSKLFKGEAYRDLWDEKLFYYTMSLLAAACGLRSGETSALQSV